MRGGILVLLLVGAGFLVSGGVGLWADCTECTTCSADPVFVQRDARNPLMLLVVKRLGSKRMQDEGLQTVIVLSDTMEPSSGEGGTAQTLVLISSEGTVESRQVSGELPPEVKLLVGLENGAVPGGAK